MSEITVEQLYQDIGLAAIAIAKGLAGKLLLYAEVEDGAVSADMFYESAAGPVQFRFCPENLQQLVYSLWEAWKATPGNKEWRAMSYVVDDGKFNIELQYPDQIDPVEDVSDRRPVVVHKYFGDAKVDYSQP
ncbi:hypothetical protein ACKI2N_032050 [Cupriavidus sp. 30B13]|uniref:hypothetical protein n=1 Tax=Cupriavidus sp. 30B13 TaxID=3384241 RepID=UPI003B9134C2